MVIVVTVLGLGLFGIGRSLWVDEAWVANSIQSPTLHGMFFYPGWLQVSPPLFLLLARAAVKVTGASNAAFRIVPLSMAIAAAALLLAASRRVLSAPLAGLATAFVMFDLTAIEYSRTLKPYSGELASTAALLLATPFYFDRPDGKRFAWLLSIVAVALPLSYPTVFLLPGITAAVLFIGPRSRAVWICMVAGGELLAMYLLLIRFNLAPGLHDFWAADPDNRLTISLTAALLFCVFASIRAGLIFARRKPATADWFYLVCLLPCLVLAASAAARLYPVSHRTRLFALPCFVLLAMMTVHDLLRRTKVQAGVTAAIAMGLTFGLAGFAIANQVIEARDVPEEDYASAVAFLRDHAAASDLIMVHACCEEGFLLYSGMLHWKPAHLAFGDTGWPCCVPGKDARSGSSSEQAVIADIDAKIPRGYSGRVWLLFTTRPTHWAYTGINEGELWRKHLWGRGCPPGPYLRFANLALSPMNCAASR